MRVAHTGIVCEDAESLRSRRAVDKHPRLIRETFSAEAHGLLGPDEPAAEDRLDAVGPVAGPDVVAEFGNPGTTGAELGARMRTWMSPTHFEFSDSRTLPTGATSALPTGARSCGPTLTQADRPALRHGSTRPSMCCASSAVTVSGRYTLERRRRQPTPRPLHDRHHPTNWLPTMIPSTCSSGWQRRRTKSVMSYSSTLMTGCLRWSWVSHRVSGSSPPPST